MIIYKTYHFIGTPMVVTGNQESDLILKSIEKTSLFFEPEYWCVLCNEPVQKNSLVCKLIILGVARIIERIREKLIPLGAY